MCEYRLDIVRFTFDFGRKKAFEGVGIEWKPSFGMASLN